MKTQGVPCVPPVSLEARLERCRSIEIHHVIIHFFYSRHCESEICMYLRHRCREHLALCTAYLQVCQLLRKRRESNRNDKRDIISVELDFHKLVEGQQLKFTRCCVLGILHQQMGKLISYTGSNQQTISSTLS